MSKQIAPTDLPLDPREAPAPATSGDGSATYYRLSEDAWAAIVAEYQAGATAKHLAVKWRVSPGSVYRHVGAAGATKEKRGAAVGGAVLAAEAERRVEAQAQARAEVLAAEAQAKAPAEHDPAAAAQALMRRAAAAALAGRLSQASEGLKLAEGLARVSRMLAEAGGGSRGGAQEVEEEDEDDDAWAGLSDEEHAAQRAALVAELEARAPRLALPAWDSPRRLPPQRLPHYANLELCPEFLPLAVAMGLARPGDREVECYDFEAALAKATRQGREREIERVLSTPLAQQLEGWPECLWRPGYVRSAPAAEAEAAFEEG